MLVELLPIEAWLLVFAGYQGVSIDQAAVPFWALFAAMALAWWIARRTRDAGQRAALSAGVVPFILAYLVLLRVSPAAYGGEGGPLDVSWLGTLASDFATSSHREGNLFGLLLLLILVWWRGTALGADPEAHSGNLRRFALFMGGLLLALVGAVAAKPETQDALAAALTLILLAEVFVGLLDAALARIAEVRQESHGSTSQNEASWVRAALALALAVVAISFVVSLVFNFQGFLALLNTLGPIGAAISNVLTILLSWFIAGVAKLLSLLDLVVRPLGIKVNVKPVHVTDPQQGGVCKLIQGKLVCPNLQSSGIPPLSLIILQLAILCLVVGVILWLVWMSVARRARPERVGDEERESLDAQRLFAAQLRALFSRRGRREQQTEEALPRGSVRYLYREVLRAAKGHGLERRTDETPDEFAGRLGKTAPIAMFSTTEGSDLLALSDAYDDARYADREPEPRERERLQAVAARLTRLFHGQERGRR